MVSVKSSLKTATDLLSESGNQEASAEAQLLLAYILNKSRTWLFTWPDHELTHQQSLLFQQLINRRCSGEPISYITGKREFYGLDFKVNTHTLIPRHETETLVEMALQKIKHNQASVLELGTGSGAITTAIASEKKDWKFTATDISSDTLAVAQDNFHAHNLEVETILSNWFQSIPPEQYDLIVSNPPYIESEDPHTQQGDLRFEPELALVSGEDGLQAIRTITLSCHHYLKPGAYLMLEHGYNQRPAVQQLFHDADLQNIETIKDLQGNDRMTLGIKA